MGGGGLFKVSYLPILRIIFWKGGGGRWTASVAFVIPVVFECHFTGESFYSSQEGLDIIQLQL